jgi:NAD(P)H-hydrate repair Nnr-like enzyme with NAD(P)H-hydrate epimerase domain/8-oxo-dGTP pyrophosphatase MutT (NUDIX family)
VADWDRLWSALAGLAGGAVAPPVYPRVGAALVLLRELPDGDLELVYTRRRDDLRAHPGQISFPGGRVDPGETVEQAALREAHEEVALDPATATVLGGLPAFYIPPSRFWLLAVVARWDRPHALVPAEAEVAAVLAVRLTHLLDPDRWRAVRMSVAGWSWAWDLGDGHLLWGATAMLTAQLLDLLVGDWSGGLTPADLPADRQLTPWRGASGQVPVPGPARLTGTAELHPEQLAAVAGAGVADAVRRLPRADGVGVLVGSGWTGAVGLVAATALARDGLRVHVTLGGPTDRLPAGAASLEAEARAAGLRPAPFDGDLPADAIIVDALVGRGLSGSLHGRPVDVAHRLRAWLPTVLAVDVPSGLDATTGLVGELIPADLTVAVGLPAPGLFGPGLAPFVGDLYVAPLTAGALVRLVPGPDGITWRE